MKLLAAGVRTLVIEESVELLHRMFPCEEVRQRTINGANLLNKEKTLRITSDVGTDLTIGKEGRLGIS